MVLITTASSFAYCSGMATYIDQAEPYITRVGEISSKVYDRVVSWLLLQSSYGLPDEFMWSTALGVVVAVGMFTFGNKQLSEDEKTARMKTLQDEDRAEGKEPPAEELKQEGKKAAKKKDGEKDDLTLDEILYPQVEMNEEQILKKTEKMRKMFGATDEETREAIRKAKDQQRRGLSAAEVEMEEPFIKNVVWMLEKTMLVACIVGGIWSLNIMTGGDVGRMLLGIFPRELEMLGLREYFLSIGQSHGDALAPKGSETNDPEPELPFSE